MKQKEFQDRYQDQDIRLWMKAPIKKILSCAGCETAGQNFCFEAPRGRPS